MMNPKNNIVRFVSFAVGILTRTVNDSDSEIEGLFKGWFNNHMAMILMAVQHIKARDRKTLDGIRLFLSDIEHHYIPSKRTRLLDNAFEHLRSYFSVYPNVKVRNSYTAIKMVGRIYEAMGMKLKPSGEFKPKLSNEETYRREIRQSGREVLAPVACVAN